MKNWVANFLVVGLVLLQIGCIRRASGNEKMQQSSSVDLKHYCDSLLNRDVDTMLLYYRHCNGCLPGTQDFLCLIWMENGRALLKSNQNHNLAQPMLYGKLAFVEFVANKDSISASAKLEEPNYAILHGWESGIRLRIGLLKYDFSIFDHSIAENGSRYSVRYLDRVEGMILRFITATQ